MDPSEDDLQLKTICDGRSLEQAMNDTIVTHVKQRFFAHETRSCNERCALRTAVLGGRSVLMRRSAHPAFHLNCS